MTYFDCFMCQACGQNTWSRERMTSWGKSNLKWIYLTTWTDSMSSHSNSTVLQCALSMAILWLPTSPQIPYLAACTPHCVRSIIYPVLDHVWEGIRHSKDGPTDQVSCATESRGCDACTWAEAKDKDESEVRAGSWDSIWTFSFFWEGGHADIRGLMCWEILWGYLLPTWNSLH